MKIVITGADGFLGWHLRCRLHALTEHEVIAVGLEDWENLDRLASDAEAIIHLAGINRASEQELVEGNTALAQKVAEIVLSASIAPRVIYANSIQAGNGTPYGIGKLAAARVLAEACAQRGVPCTDVRLPNLFGEHGRPAYNSFVATFVAKVIAGEKPSVEERPINLLHVQKAAQVFIDALVGEGGTVEPVGQDTSVVEVLKKLQHFHQLYVPAGDLPELSDDFDIDLFNTYRAALFPEHYPVKLVPRTDERGRLVETMRCHGTGGQTFVSTTKPGVTRGDHYHLHKVERFVVLEGEAEISLRRMFTDEVVTFPVTGDEPVAIDMPTMWTHNITATGDRVVTTQFWTNSLFDPENPDTFWVKVSPSA